MLKFISLSSGSKGNSALVETDQVKILIDLGMNYPYMESSLESVGVEPMEIDAILITHIHSDHTKGLKQFVKKTHVKVFVPLKMKQEILTIVDEDNIEFLDDITDFLDMSVELIYTSHDTDCSVGYVITSGESSLVYITDTGYINRKYMNLLSNHDLYFLESNHDEEMLMDGPYPYYLKQRVISDSGHLSNKTTAKYLSTFIGDKTKYIILAHISEKNNTEELALKTTLERIEGLSDHTKVMIARQNEKTELIEV